VNADRACAPSGRVALIGLGNRLRGDDAIGPTVGDRVLDRLRRLDARSARDRVDLHCGQMDAMAIVAAWSSAESAIVIDAAIGGERPGTLHRFELSTGSDRGAAPRPQDEPTLLPRSLARASSHGLGLTEAIGLGRALGRLPARLVCYAIEAQAFGHGQCLSPEVDEAVEASVSRIADEIVATWHHRHPPPPPAACGD
jgi:hydrogenase maturation protease